MNTDYEKCLEAEIDRALHGLPQREAPPTLLARVMVQVAKRSKAPWYRRSWQAWPWTLRGLILALLLAVFGAICLAGWMVPQGEDFRWAVRDVARFWSGLSAVGNALTVVLGAFVGVLKQFGLLLIVPCLVSLALGYSMCVGLGAVCYRWAFARS